MTIRNFLLAIPLAAIGTVAYSHGDHAPPQIAQCKAECGMQEVLDGAKNFLPTLVGNKGLEKTWLDAAGSATAEQKQFGKKSEWVVTFKNDKVADTKKQKLYVFVRMNATLSGANFTGE